MKIIGCDFHPSYQQIAMVDTRTGSVVGRGAAWSARQLQDNSPLPAAPFGRGGM